jgi:hypothetical protein
MSNFTTGKKSTRKASRKDDGARVTAHAMSQGRSAKAQGQLKHPGSPETAAESAAAQVPTVAEEQSSGGYVDREHVRRDIGSHVLVLDLAAEDAPEDAPKPFLDPDGVEQRYAAQCISHDQIAFFESMRQAVTAAKASHQWCTGCAQLLSGTAKVHSKAREQQRGRS